MSKLSMLVFLNSYSDTNSTNNPSYNNFKWTREISGLSVSNPLSETISLAPSETKNIFSGSRTLLADGTTNYSISLKPLTSNTYILTATSGTMPNFRTPRSLSIDATTQISVTLNGPLAIFTSTGGTALNTASVSVGDYLRTGTLFNALSRGEYKIIAKTSNSVTVENQTAVAEGPITLGAGFADQFQIYSSSGVQINDTLVLSSGFSSVTLGSYKITSVGPNFLEFYSTSILPQESSIISSDLAIYSSAKTFIYLESDQKITATINGSLVTKIEPFIINNSKQPGVFMLKSTVYSLQLQNNSTDSASVFFASVE